MYSLFNITSPIVQGVIRNPDWAYVRDGLRRNLGQVISYYSRFPTAVPSSHFLVRLLHAITTPKSQNLHRYWDNVDASALNIAMVLKMTSSIFKGEVFDGVFYGHGNTEILIANNESFDVELAHRNWKALEPIVVLRHPRSDLGLNIPDGTNTGTESGLVVVSINIPMLAVQYRAFRINETLVSQGVDSERSIYQFIRMYPLTNMLFSHLDQVLFNRIDNLQKGAPMGESIKHHAVFLPDYAPKLNAFQRDLLTTLERVGKDFVGILRTIPAVTKLDMDQAMHLPNFAPTRQVMWALAISRLNTLAFVFRASKDGVRMRNQSEVNKIERAILSYKTNNLMRSMLPLGVLYDVLDEIDAITQSR